LLLRQEEQPKPIPEIAWKAQLRLCARYRKLARTGKQGRVGSLSDSLLEGRRIRTIGSAKAAIAALAA
jgi:hypothetical protein